MELRLLRIVKRISASLQDGEGVWAKGRGEVYPGRNLTSNAMCFYFLGVGESGGMWGWGRWGWGRWGGVE